MRFWQIGSRDRMFGYENHDKLKLWSEFPKNNWYSSSKFFLKMSSVLRFLKLVSLLLQMLCQVCGAPGLLPGLPAWHLTAPGSDDCWAGQHHDPAPPADPGGHAHQSVRQRRLFPRKRIAVFTHGGFYWDICLFPYNGYAWDGLRDYPVHQFSGCHFSQ